MARSVIVMSTATRRSTAAAQAQPVRKSARNSLPKQANVGADRARPRDWPGTDTA